MELRLRRSRLMLAYLLLVHLSALILIKLLVLNLLVTSMFWLLIIASLLYYCRYYGWLDQPIEISDVSINHDGFWFLFDRRSSNQVPMRLNKSVILGPLIAIYLKPTTGRLSKSLLIMRDAVDTDVWRQLRVRLRDPESWGQ